MWYNDTANTLKFQFTNTNTSGSWSTGGTMNSARVIAASAGTKDSGLVFGGKVPPSTAITESYNGTSWTEVNDLNTARQALGGSGISNTAALAFGGTVPPDSAVTELWNGSNWTEVNDLNAARQSLAGSGT